MDSRIAADGRFRAALDAASRGLRTALVERDDFSSGTKDFGWLRPHASLRRL